MGNLGESNFKLSRKEEIKTMIKESVKRYMPNDNYRLFIFGSQANLKELRRSDIDVGIDFNGPLDSAIHTLIWSDLDDLPTLYKIDFVDFGIVRESFKNNALKNIEMLHGLNNYTYTD